jgi:hypothetical protein
MVSGMRYAKKVDSSNSPEIAGEDPTLERQRRQRIDTDIDALSGRQAHETPFPQAT